MMKNDFVANGKESGWPARMPNVGKPSAPNMPVNGIRLVS
jgi:hypothetical protein